MSMYESITKHLPAFKGMRKKEEMHLEMRTQTIVGDDGKEHEIISFGGAQYSEDIDAFVSDVRDLTANIAPIEETYRANGISDLGQVVPAKAGPDLVLAALKDVTSVSNYESGALSDALISGFVRSLVNRLDAFDRATPRS